jgi:hypothetical protein
VIFVIKRTNKKAILTNQIIVNLSTMISDLPLLPPKGSITETVAVSPQKNYTFVPDEHSAHVVRSPEEKL